MIVKAKDLINSKDSANKYLSSFNLTTLYYSLEKLVLSILNLSYVNETSNIIIDFITGNVTISYKNGSSAFLDINSFEFELNILDLLSPIIKPTHLIHLNDTIGREITINVSFGQFVITKNS